MKALTKVRAFFVVLPNKKSTSDIQLSSPYLLPFLH